MYTIPSSFKKVGVFSLSNRTVDQRAALGLSNLEKVWGVKGVCGEYQTVSRRFAGEDSERADVFNRMVKGDSISMLIAMRGGYGATRVLEKIDFEALQRFYSRKCVLIILKIIFLNF